MPPAESKLRDAGSLSRAQGCLLGQIAGDALGSLVEFQSAAEIDRKYPGGIRLLRDGGTWNTIAGQPTDDSELALMLARSIIQEGSYVPEATVRAYVWWLQSDPFDVGDATRQALGPGADAVRAGKSPAQEVRNHASKATQANGALMRVSPLGIFGAYAEESQVIRWAMEDAALTHPNVVCQHSNAVFASALAFAIRTGDSCEAVYSHAVSEACKIAAVPAVMSTLEAARHNRPQDYSHKMGWVLIALQNAFWQLLQAPSLEEGVSATVQAGGDTDTNGAIAGALLGAVHGVASVPQQWINSILTCRPLAGTPGVANPRPQCFWPVDAPWLAERLLFLGASEHPEASRQDLVRSGYPMKPTKLCASGPRPPARDL